MKEMLTIIWHAIQMWIMIKPNNAKSFGFGHSFFLLLFIHSFIHFFIFSFSPSLFLPNCINRKWLALPPPFIIHTQKETINTYTFSLFIHTNKGQNNENRFNFPVFILITKSSIYLHTMQWTPFMFVVLQMTCFPPIELEMKLAPEKDMRLT